MGILCIVILIAVLVAAVCAITEESGKAIRYGDEKAKEYYEGKEGREPQMPRTPNRPCRYPGCPNLCESGTFCREHRKEWSPDALRGNAAARGYDARWRKARETYLRKHPLCVICKEEGRLTPATVVDHIIPHRGNQVLFWDEKNWQPLCKDCHDKKTGYGL